MTEPQTPGPGSGRRPLNAALLDLAYVLRRLVEQMKLLLDERRGQGESPLRPGVFVAASPGQAAAVTAQATAAGWTVTRVSGEGITTKAGFLQELARSLRFPDYFGHNWDALADCLGDMTWDPATGYLLMLDHFDQFAEASPVEWATALRVLRQATDEWQGRNRSMLVVLSGPRVAGPEIPSLD